MKVKYRLWIRRGLVAVVVLAATVVLLWAVADWLTSARLREEMRLSREAGFPLSPAEMRMDPVPGEENAAPVYLKIQRLLGDSDLRQRVKDIGKAASDDALTLEEKRETIRGLWNTETDRLLGLAKEAAGRPRFDADLDYDRGLDPWPSHVAHFRRVVRLLQGAFLIAEPEERAGLLLPMLRPATHLLEEPTFVSQLTRVAIVSMVLATWEEGWEQLPHGGGDMAGAMAELAKHADPLPWQTALEVEAGVFGMQLHEAIVTGDVASQGVGLPTTRWTRLTARPIRPIMNFIQTGDLHADRRLRDLLFSEPTWRVLENIDEFDADEVMSRHSISGRIKADTYFGLRHTAAATEARVRVARVAWALERHRLRHGAYPTNLDSLDPDILPNVPPDPMTGEPLRYHQDGDGFLLHSVGLNRRDDGGEHGGRNDPEDRDDIAWRVNRNTS